MKYNINLFPTNRQTNWSHTNIQTFQTIQTRYILNLSKNYDINKATGIDDLSGRFLKDGVDILTMPIT